MDGFDPGVFAKSAASGHANITDTHPSGENTSVLPNTVTSCIPSERLIQAGAKMNAAVAIDSVNSKNAI
ncbi:hypothetical protein HS961_10770 [Comamonas piscis]|uniref:Uncharacterized protein n=1 Tax=Comamonas piscis TaxID=1562974 RepID=A0A7G5EGZ5_9BURK|nr:hypothetical protein [Comamonas piscis]QMV73270.1 hypothetical protein HS961_10770 [Comamonas piscis]WSO36068.1 hypothetical protein VUJ63_10805 [Comamonas piscis]